VVGGTGGRWFKGTHRFIGALLVTPFVRQRLRPLIHRDRKSDLETLKDLIEAGKLTPVVSAHYPLAEVPDAIRHFAQGHARGKVAITVWPPTAATSTSSGRLSTRPMRGDPCSP